MKPRWYVFGGMHNGQHSEASSNQSLEEAIRLYHQSFMSWPKFWECPFLQDYGHITCNGEPK